MAALTYRERKFYWHGEPHQILSGAIHYFRIPRRDWRHRLECLKALGFNCVETYVPWNLHERERGQFDFSGELDLCYFLALAAELDLHVIFRPGPYICAEWDFGGLPAYLLAELEAEELRHASPRFLAAVEGYFSELIPRIRPYLETAGGLLCMGINYFDLGKKTGAMAAKILSGEKVGDLSVFEMEDFDFYFKSETLKALGLELPQEWAEKGHDVDQPSEAEAK